MTTANDFIGRATAADKQRRRLPDPEHYQVQEWEDGSFSIKRFGENIVPYGDTGLFIRTDAFGDAVSNPFSITADEEEAQGFSSRADAQKFLEDSEFADAYDVVPDTRNLGQFTFKEKEPGKEKQGEGEIVRGEDIGGPPGTFFIRQPNGNLTSYTPPAQPAEAQQAQQAEPRVPSREIPLPDGSTVLVDQFGGYLDTIPKPPTPTINEMIAEDLIAGNTAGAQKLFDFTNQMTPYQREQLALQWTQEGRQAFDQMLDYAQSPADLLTIVGMRRGELPVQAQEGGFQRIAPDSQAFQGAQPPGPTDRFVPAGAQPQQPPPAAGPVTFNGAQVPASTTDPGAQALRAMGVQGIPPPPAGGPAAFTGQNFQALAPPGGFVSAGGRVLGQPELDAGFEGEDPNLPSGLGRSVRDLQRSVAAGHPSPFATTPTETQIGPGFTNLSRQRALAQEAAPATTFDATTGRSDKPTTKLPAGWEWRFNGERWVSLNTAERRAQRDAARFQAGATTTTPTRFQPAGTTPTTASISPTLAAQSNAVSRFGQSPGGYPSFIREALGDSVLSRGAEPKPKSFAALGSLPNRSAQTRLRQGQLGRQFYEGAVALTGVRPQDFLEDEARSTAIGGPRRPRARFMAGVK
ncbi:MAG: hypothetical protein Q8R28_06735 [Dehalococcoidia bacterium]|nr:hypothetical protein [Dehalococcoidia bacterium]